LKLFDFILHNPSYPLIVIASAYAIYRVIRNLYDSDDNEDGPDDGGISPEDPDLDLPPGISLPDESVRKEELVY
jgi:hypothetical protein